jgi:glycosyltransferase involved in cell wall biosynthesis
VYLSYPFVASWSLREALACGCAVIGGDTATVTEFLHHGENSCVVPTLDSNALANEILRVLEDRKMSAKLRRGARAYAEEKLDLQDHLAKFRGAIEDVSGQPLIANASRLRHVA